jgi:putative nucleic acid modification protein with dual OB domain
MFYFSGVRYSLWVTDPVIENMYLALADGVYNLDTNYLTVSLSGPYLGRCYKLVAAIMGGIRDD